MFTITFQLLNHHRDKIGQNSIKIRIGMSWAISLNLTSELGDLLASHLNPKSQCLYLQDEIIIVPKSEGGCQD